MLSLQTDQELHRARDRLCDWSHAIGSSARASELTESADRGRRKADGSCTQINRRDFSGVAFRSLMRKSHGKSVCVCRSHARIMPPREKQHGAAEPQEPDALALSSCEAGRQQVQAHGLQGSPSDGDPQGVSHHGGTSRAQGPSRGSQSRVRVREAPYVVNEARVRGVRCGARGAARAGGRTTDSSF
jgi:hypothetical protein